MRCLKKDYLLKKRSHISILEEWYAELGYADYPGALQRYRLKDIQEPATPANSLNPLRRGPGDDQGPRSLTMVEFPNKSAECVVTDGIETKANQVLKT